MDIFQKITEEEQNAMISYIKDYADSERLIYSMKSPLSYIMRFWAENKEDLCQVLGGHLILSKEIFYERPSDILEDDIHNMTMNEGFEFYQNYRRFLDKIYKINPYLYYQVQLLMDNYSLAQNVYVGDSFLLPGLEGHKDIRVNRGCKNIKILGKIAKEYNLEGFEEFRIGHSMCLNQKKLKGNLCLSIHPLDFMTMSDNDCDWESCMSWQDYGSYRQGTVEMMNSSYIVVAYLASETPMSVGGIDWSNKKWRQLFVVTPDMIMGIKAYPYQCDECEGTALKWLRELSQKNMGWGPYTSNTVKISNRSKNIFAEIDKTSSIDLYMNHMYNDIGDNQRGFVSVNFPKDYCLNLSGQSECMCCGTEFEGDEDDDMLVCNDCGKVFRCSECGDRIYNEDEVYYYEGNSYCHYCFSNLTAVCEYCEETVDSSSIVEVFMKHLGCGTGYSIQVCPDCLNSADFQKDFGEVSYERLLSNRWHDYVVDSKNFSDVGWNFFLPSQRLVNEYKEELKQNKES